MRARGVATPSPQLVSHALRGTPARAVSEEAMAGLSAYHWPGNVRELFHVLQRAAVLCGGEVIDALDLPSAEPAHAPSGAGTNGTNANGNLGAAINDEDLALHPAVARLEKQLISKALERAKGNRSAAARLLGIGRPLLYAKLEEHGIAARRAMATRLRRTDRERTSPLARPALSLTTPARTGERGPIRARAEPDPSPTPGSEPILILMRSSGSDPDPIRI